MGTRIVTAGLCAYGLALFAGTAGAQLCTGDCDGDGRVAVWELVQGVLIGLDEPDAPACLAADRNIDDRVSIDELMLGVNHGLDGCPLHSTTLATAVAADFSSGGFAAADVDSRAAIFLADEQHPASTDSTPRVAGGIALLVNRFGADTITALDPRDDFATLWECSTGSGSNPQDVAVVTPNKAYASLLGSADLLVFDPSPSPDCVDFEVGRIDLSGLADADGIPEMAQMALVGELLYVALQKLTNFAPSGPGAVAIIDTTTDTIAGAIELSASNPFSLTKGLLVRDGFLYVAQIGSFGSADAGLERINLDTGISDGLILTEQALDGDLNDFVIVSDELGYATVASFQDFTSSIVPFDPGSGDVLGSIGVTGATIADIELNDRGELWVADRGAQGLRVFDAESGNEISAAPIATGLLPFELVFLR